MTSPRLLLAAGTAAAALVSIGPAVHAGTASSAPLRVGAGGLAISATVLRSGGSAAADLVVPQGDTELTGVSSGSPALNDRTQLQVVRVSDGATLFTGSLATFHALPVVAGTELRVEVEKPIGFAGLKGAAVLRWN